MYDLLLRILEKWACHHDWELYKEIKFVTGPEDEIPYKREHTMLCKSCGKFKKLTL